ncbi:MULTISPECIES: GrpB family protein [Microbacterium]|uniref:GrpB family protein n=1 Tax=Microbacterium TaxID=33882 RepID=UPI0022F11A9A|nr:GrpB family protein [Streptomyces sp. MS2A]
MENANVEWFGQPIGDAVEIYDASVEWAEVGRRWERLLSDALAPLPTRVDHVGSTSVPGLAAKPVIDLQVQVPDLADEAAYALPLESLGMVLRARGEEFRFFRPPAGRVRDAHVHVCTRDSTWALDHLAFRDALRLDATLARRYERLKRRLAETGSTRADYNRGKEAFILDVIARRTGR